LADKEEPVVVYTDGGCRPNPGLGGWGAVLLHKGREKELSGAEPDTTNNRMELTAAVSALEALKRPCKVVIHTDSQYLQRGVTEWMPSWKRNGWKRREGAVKNLDLWQELDRLTQVHEVKWYWVKGHAGHVYNERCDVLASEAMDRLVAAGPASSSRRNQDCL
jgi:ribonuclease HI